MTVQRFQKIPIVVEAIQWTGDNEAEIVAWVGDDASLGMFYALDAEDRANCDDMDATATVFDRLHSTWVLVFTGQWVIKGVQGEFYPCADDVFKVTYAEVGGIDTSG